MLTPRIGRRQRDLDQREQQLQHHGKNNWPFCIYVLLFSVLRLILRSLPSYLPRYFCGDPRSIKAFDKSALPTLARTPGNPRSQHDCLYLHSHSWILRWWKRCRRSYRVCALYN